MSARIHIVVNLQRRVALVLFHLLLDTVQTLAHTLHVDAHFKLEHNLTDKQCAYFRHRGLVGTEHSLAEPLAQSAAHLNGCRLDTPLVFVLHIYIYKVVERWVVEQSSLGKQLCIERLPVVVYNLPYHRLLHIFSLENNQSSAAFAPSSSCHLRHHREGMFIGAEVRLVEHRVGIEDAHHFHVVEVESLAHHLRTDKNLSPAGRKIIYYPFIGIAGASGVEVHSCYGHSGEEFHNLFLNLLRAIAVWPEVFTLAVRTFLWYRVCKTAVVARKLIHVFVERQTDIAVFAFRNPSAHPAFYHRGKAAAVLEKYHLFAVFQRFLHGMEQHWRHRTVHHLAALHVLYIHNFNLRQFDALVSLVKFNESEFSVLGIVPAFGRRSCRAEQRLRPKLLSQHDSHAACVIARGGILLLE